MVDRARFRINLAQRELEIEGSEAFVAGYADRIEALLSLLEQPGTFEAAPMSAGDGAGSATAGAGSSLGEFGEYIQRLPSSATEVDKMLAAGFWVQLQSPDDAFATAEANRRLTEHGIKLGNPSQCVKQSQLARRVFMVQRGRYRVSQIGRTYLRQLLGGLIPE